MTRNDILEAAREHADRLREDVKLAFTRIEHVRVTARANEAANLVSYLETLTGETDAIQDGEPNA